MSSILYAIILGIIQGLTEFLPVSSSGHLEIVKFILGDESVPEQSLMMTVVLHGATALSTLIIFRKEVFEIIKGLFLFKSNDELWFSVKIIISMIPAVAIGLIFESEINRLFEGKLLLVGFMLILTGFLLFLADKAKKTDKKISFKSAFIIGISQAIAILPGISRSGATISTSVLLGIDRSRAARFSFLMVVPIIFGKMAKDLMSGESLIIGDQKMVLLIGFLAAFLTGLVACKWMIKLVKNSNLSYFSYYCFIIGIVSILYTI
ncbi:MAG: undecaprenyl-diphosphate phosphatase [Flavobacteriales bacterium]